MFGLCSAANAELRVVAIATGDAHNLVLASDGTVWAWGENDSGQLGNGTRTVSSTPVQVSALAGVAAVTAGYKHSAALKSDGTVWAWGASRFGMSGELFDRREPVQVIPPPDQSVGSAATALSQ